MHHLISNLVSKLSAVRNAVLATILSLGLTVMGWSLSGSGFGSGSGSGFAIANPLTTVPVASQSTLLVAKASAADIFQDAYEHRYTWDENFPGYQAEVSIRWGENVDQGLVFVGPNGSVDVRNIEDDATRQVIQEQLQMEMIHRRSRPFDAIHRQQQFQIGETRDDGAIEIVETDMTNAVPEPGTKRDRTASYLIKNHKITQVNRTMGSVEVTVNTLGWITPPEGDLPTHFEAIFRDIATGAVLEKDDVRDFHEKIGSYYLLTEREIRSGEVLGPRQKPLADIWIRFNDIQPLSSV